MTDCEDQGFCNDSTKTLALKLGRMVKIALIFVTQTMDMVSEIFSFFSYSISTDYT